MREIKFRAWNGKQMVMNVQNAYKYGNDWYNSKGEPIDPYETNINLTSFSDVLKDKFIQIMQYTGLKDKNGKEIYEGDLLKHTEDNLNRVHEVRWEVEEWDEDGFHTGFHRSFTADQYKVIGNIYENPELLENK